MLEIDVIYVVYPQTIEVGFPTYAVSPDGIGVYWYDELEEAEEDTGAIYRLQTTDAAFELLRYP